MYVMVSDVRGMLQNKRESKPAQSWIKAIPIFAFFNSLGKTRFQSGGGKIKKHPHL